MSASSVLGRLAARSPPLALKLNRKPISASTNPLRSSPQSQVSASAMRRLPVELSSMVSMMPLHSAIASTRLRSMLSVESQSWGLIPQGISMPL